MADTPGAPSELEQRMTAATALGASDAQQAAAQLLAVISDESAVDADATRVKEQAITNLCDLHIAQQDAKALSTLLPQLNMFFSTIPKAKTAKIVRTVIDSIAKIPGATSVQVDVCKQQVEWAKAEKRTFLRQRIELRLATLYLETKEFQASLGLIGT